MKNIITRPKNLVPTKEILKTVQRPRISNNMGRVAWQSIASSKELIVYLVDIEFNNLKIKRNLKII